MLAKLLVRRISHALLLNVSPFVIDAQQKTITGKVMGDKDGAPLSDVAVSAKGCNGGAENNGNGAYSLSLSDFAKTLIFSYVGFTWK